MEIDVLGKMTKQHTSAEKSKPKTRKSRKRVSFESDSASQVKSKRRKITDASTLNYSGLCMENTMKENYKHSCDAPKCSTAHAIRITDKRTVESPKSIDQSDTLFNVVVPDYSYQCEVEDTGEMEEMGIENESFVDMKYDGSCFSKSEEPETSKSDDLCTDEFSCNTQG